MLMGFTLPATFSSAPMAGVYGHGRQGDAREAAGKVVLFPAHGLDHTDRPRLFPIRTHIRPAEEAIRVCPVLLPKGWKVLGRDLRWQQRRDPGSCKGPRYLEGLARDSTRRLRMHGPLTSVYLLNLGCC